MLETIAADGDSVLTPVITFKDAQFTASCFGSEKLENYWYGYSPNGYKDAIITSDYLENIFEPETAPRAKGKFASKIKGLISRLFSCLCSGAAAFRRT
jgi:hypothetical protein